MAKKLKKKNVMSLESLEARTLFAGDGDISDHQHPMGPVAVQRPLDKPAKRPLLLRAKQRFSIKNQ